MPVYRNILRKGLFCDIYFLDEIISLATFKYWWFWWSNVVMQYCSI